MSAPALPCPAWCQGHTNTTSHQLHRYEGGRIAWVPFVTLYLSDYGDDKPVLASCNGQLSLHVTGRGDDVPEKGILIGLDDRKAYQQAKNLAGLLGALGHPDLAAAITELLELADPDGVFTGSERAFG